MEEDSTEEIYNSFCRSLSKPVGERFFDEDELVSVFDYAGDRGDDYVRMEVLLCGARLYPDSVPLAERRAIFYASMDTVDSIDRYISDNPDSQTMLWDLIRLDSREEDPESARQALDYIFAQYDNFSDEEVIWLIKAAKDTGCYKWLTENSDRIRKKISYMPTFLYDMSLAAEENSDIATEVKCLEELVELEPFSDVYWALLVRAYAKDGREEDARQALDYAKALSSDDDAAAFYLIEAALMYGAYLTPDVIEMTEKLVEANPDEFKYTESLTALYLSVKNREKAVATLDSFFSRNPANRDCLLRLLGLGVENPAGYIRRNFAAAGEEAFDRDAVTEMTTTLLGLNSLDAMKALGEAIIESGSLFTPEVMAGYAETLFAKGLYEECFTVLQTVPDLMEDMFPNVLMAVGPVMLYLLSAVKTSRKDQAIDFIHKMTPPFRSLLEGTPVSIRALAFSVLRLMDDVSRIYASGVPESLAKEYFDPLGYMNPKQPKS